jgi:hypothetical protein
MEQNSHGPLTAATDLFRVVFGFLLIDPLAGDPLGCSGPGDSSKKLGAIDRQRSSIEDDRAVGSARVGSASSSP